MIQKEKMSMMPPIEQEVTSLRCWIGSAYIEINHSPPGYSMYPHYADTEAPPGLPKEQKP
jgi:hypothetical protein